MKWISVSATKLAMLASPGVCERCIYREVVLKLKLPGIFPGVFGAIDSALKQAVLDEFAGPRRNHNWLEPLGNVVAVRKAPSWQQFSTRLEEHRIVLRGSADLIFEEADGGIIIADLKFTRLATALRMRTVHEAQLNCLSRIAKDRGMGRIRGIGVIVCDPAAVSRRRGTWSLGMAVAVHPLQLRPELVPALAERLRLIAEVAEEPVREPACRDCLAVARVAATASRH
jgi:hypothetical protein